MKAPHRLNPYLALLIASQVALLGIDFGKLGLSSADGIDLGRWLLIFPGQVFLGVIVLALSPSLWRSLRSPSALVFSAWIGWNLLTTLWSVDPRQSVIQGIGAINLWLAAAWLTAEFGPETFWRLSARAIAFMVFVGAIFQVVVGVDNDALRLEGLAEGFNKLAIQCGLGMIMSIGLVLTKKSNPTDWVVLAGLSLGLLASGGRGAMAATFIAMAIAVTPRLVRHRHGIYIGAFGGFALVATAGLLSAGVGSFGRSGERTALNGRELIWSYAWDLIREAPVAGHGMMTGLTLWTEAVVAGAIGFRAGSAHNMILELLVGGGAIGFALFTAAALVTCWQLVRRRQWTWFALVVLVLVAGVSESMVARPTLAFWIFGAAAAATSIETARSPGRSRQQPRSRTLEAVS